MSFLKHLIPTWSRFTGDQTKANDAILSALDKELTAVEQEAIYSKIQSSLETSTGEWLDLYGKWFGLARRDKEVDQDYRERIIRYVLLKRGTIPAIIEAIREFLQDYESHIEIYEPYRNIFTLNRSMLNGEDHLMGRYYNIAVIDIRFTKAFPLEIADVINAFKPAGVKFVLTYRPNTNNSCTGELLFPLASSEIKRTNTELRIMNGMVRQVRGHINLTNKPNRIDEGGVFITNKSNTNSADRLAGSFSATNSSYHLASTAIEDKVFTNSTKVEELLTSTTPLTEDFYMYTGRDNHEYAEISDMDPDTTTYVHLTMDIGTYLATEYGKQLGEKTPSGVYDKTAYLKLIDKPSISYTMSATVSPTNPVLFSIEILNVTTGTWVEVEDGRLTAKAQSKKITIDTLTDNITDLGLLFIRVRLQPLLEPTPYAFRVNYFEVGTSKTHKIEPTIDLFVLDDVKNASILSEEQTVE